MTMAEEKKPFVPPEDRPAVKLEPTTRLSELTVRDLQTILGIGTGPAKKIEIKEPIKEHKDLKLEKPDKFEKHEKPELKSEIKDHKLEKPDKIEKHEKPELKNEVKEHKPEIKDIKELKPELEKPQLETQPDPTQGGDPAGLSQLSQILAGLTTRLDQLSNQVA